MGRRHELRASISLPVSLSGLDPDGNPVVQRATTVDISHSGACVRVMGLRTAPGAIFNLVYQGKRAKYRVVWVGEANTTRANEIGMVALDPSQTIWDLPTSEYWRDDFEPAAAAVADQSVKSEENSERRRYPRIKCNGSAKLVVSGPSSFPIGGRVSDISLGGGYVETHSPVPINSELDFELTFPEGVICGKGIVRGSHPGVGVGIRFDSFAEGSLSILERLMTGASGDDVNIRLKLEPEIFSNLCQEARRQNCSVEELAQKVLTQLVQRAAAK